ncbi:alginate lyase family protein [Flexithrix dorotheae]|uniref:alginate lyase family protein n=1 Tax=Flexithrix dorotheae TaxID=70993 RepID=UPI0005C6F881|nr:alginate lyase family protein [Flexithrix dorotheae]
MKCVKLSLFALIFMIFSCQEKAGNSGKDEVVEKVPSSPFDKAEIIKKAEKFMNMEVITITSFSSERSEGGIHDFYSEGDYWWEDPENPEGPYIRKDGMTNPDNFTKHREAVMRLSEISGALGAAYRITGEDKYVEELKKHLVAWFVDPETKMNPNLMYAQAIKGRVSGRGIGIIDTIHLIEVSQAAHISRASQVWSEAEITGIIDWFSQYVEWMTTHQYGLDERDNGNNHSSTWAMQVAAFSTLTGNEEAMDFCRKMYKEVLLPEQMDEKGGFPKELGRTKPYNYSLFNLDAFATICQILSTPENNLFSYTTEDGRGMKLGMEFMYPYIADKSKWPYPQDVLYWDNWPVRQPSLLFSGLAFNQAKYIELWKTLDGDPQVFEVKRNTFARNPVLWVSKVNL